MGRIVTASPKVLAAASVLLVGVWLVSAAQPGAPADKSADSAAVAKAREQAKLMHGVYASTLEVMHHYFFRRDRAVLPARALEDVFADMERQSKIKTKWIAVNAKVMNIDHQPTSDFEKNAARAIAAGKGEYEKVEGGYYYRAGAIPLAQDCVSCHSGFFAKGPQTQRFAGLVISVPLSEK